MDSTPPSTAGRTRRPRPSTKGRTLMRWDPGQDQLVLLAIAEVIARGNATINWEDVAALVNDHVSGEAIKQHLIKVHKTRIEFGQAVPGNSSTRQPAPPKRKRPSKREHDSDDESNHEIASSNKTGKNSSLLYFPTKGKMGNTISRITKSANKKRGGKKEPKSDADEESKVPVTPTQKPKKNRRANLNNFSSSFSTPQTQLSYTSFEDSPAVGRALRERNEATNYVEDTVVEEDVAEEGIDEYVEEYEDDEEEQVGGEPALMTPHSIQQDTTASYYQHANHDSDVFSPQNFDTGFSDRELLGMPLDPTDPGEALEYMNAHTAGAPAGNDAYHVNMLIDTPAPLLPPFFPAGTMAGYAVQTPGEHFDMSAYHGEMGGEYGQFDEKNWLSEELGFPEKHE